MRDAFSTNMNGFSDLPDDIDTNEAVNKINTKPLNEYQFMNDNNANKMILENENELENLLNNPANNGNHGQQQILDTKDQQHNIIQPNQSQPAQQAQQNSPQLQIQPQIESENNHNFNNLRKIR